MLAPGTRAGQMRAMTPRMLCLFVALIAAAVLGVAWASEYWGGLVPCALRRWERPPYRAAIVLGLGGALLPPRYARWALGAIALVMGASIALGVTHVGVEWGFWPSPLPQCVAPDLSGLT